MSTPTNSNRDDQIRRGQAFNLATQHLIAQGRSLELRKNVLIKTAVHFYDALEVFQSLTDEELAAIRE